MLELRHKLNNPLKLILFIFISFTFCNIAHIHANDIEESSIKIDDNGDIYFKGDITFLGYQQFVNLYQTAQVKPNKLRINSLGGDGLAGILLGRFIHQHGLTVVVSDYCMSSCANFVFTASPHIILDKNALIVFHGSFNQENLVSKLTIWYEDELKKKPHKDQQENNESSISFLTGTEKSLSFNYYPLYQKSCSIIGFQKQQRILPHEMAVTCARYLRQQEDDFFHKVQVDSKISIWGQVGIYTKIYEGYQYIGFYYPLDDLKELGIKQISIKENATWSPYANPYYFQVYPVSLY